MVKVVFDEDFAFFVGVLQGDGCIHKSYNKRGNLSSFSASITVGKEDYDFAIYMKGLMKKIFNCNVSLYSHKNVYRVHVFKRDLVGFLEKYKCSRIPGDIISSPFLSLYIKGLFDTDGGCNIYKNCNCGVIDFCNKDRDFVLSIKNVLENDFGIFSGLRENKKLGYDPTYRIQITNKRNITLFSNKIGFSHPRKKRKLEMLIDLYKHVDDRFMRNTSQNVILGVLKTHEYTTNELAKILKRHRETIKEHLIKMEKTGLVKKRVIYFNRWGVVEKSKFKKYCWKSVV